jgi:hypothetical protein
MLNEGDFGLQIVCSVAKKIFCRGGDVNSWQLCYAMGDGAV